MKNSLLSSSITNFLSFLSNAVITFILTPVYLSALGRYDYGLWEMVSIFIGYASMLDLGIKGALVRQTAFQLKKDGPDKVSSLYSTALMYMGTVGALISIVLILFLELSPSLLYEPVNKNTDYILFYNVMAGLIFLTFIRNAAEGVLQGRQLYAIKNILDIVIRTAVAVAIYFYLTDSNGLDFMVNIYLLSAFIAIVAYNLLLYFVSPSIHFLSRPTLTHFKELVNFGIKSLIGGSAEYLKLSSAAMVIGILMSPAYVVLYSIPKALISYIDTLVDVLKRPLLPKFTEILENHAQLKSFFYLTSNLNIWFVWTASAFMIFFGTEFMTIWLGEEQSDVINHEMVVLVCIALLTAQLNPMGILIAYAKNQHGFYAKWNPVAALVTLAVTIVGVKLYGTKGAVWALILTNIIFIPVFFSFINNMMQVSLREYFVNVLLENILVVCVIIMATVLYKYGIASKIDSYLEVVLAFIFMSVNSMIIKYYSVKYYRPHWLQELKELNSS